MNAIRAFGGLPRGERAPLAATVPPAVLAEVGLRVLPLPRLARLFGVTVGRARAAVAAGDVASLGLSREELVRLRSVDRVFRRWPGHGHCLRRALVAGRALRHRDPVLRIGVMRESGRVHAHAWIEVQGVALGAGDHRDALAPLGAAAPS